MRLCRIFDGISSSNSSSPAEWGCSQNYAHAPGHVHASLARILAPPLRDPLHSASCNSPSSPSSLQSPSHTHSLLRVPCGEQQLGGWVESRIRRSESQTAEFGQIRALLRTGPAGEETPVLWLKAGNRAFLPAARPIPRGPYWGLRPTQASTSNSAQMRCIAENMPVAGGPPVLRQRPYTAARGSVRVSLEDGGIRTVPEERISFGP